MKVLSIQDAFTKKFERQKMIGGLEYHASGHCVHIGKLSPGCHRCFVPDHFTSNFNVGPKCRANCVYCYGYDKEVALTKGETEDFKNSIIAKTREANWHEILPCISFSGGGDPLSQIDVIADIMNFISRHEKRMKEKPWCYLYTNGISAGHDTLVKLKDLGFDEIRFHIGASNFSKVVYKNIEMAARHFKAVTIETPAWPPHRKKLFEMLPMIDGMGVKHLNLGEIEITEFNYKKIFKALPNARVYQNYAIHLDDEGLVYDIMRKALQKNYSFSVLDCSSFVKSIQRCPGKHVIYEEIKDLCKKY